MKKIGVVTNKYQKLFFISHVFGWISALIGTMMILKRIRDLEQR